MINPQCALWGEYSASVFSFFFFLEVKSLEQSISRASVIYICERGIKKT